MIQSWKITHHLSSITISNKIITTATPTYYPDPPFPAPPFSQGYGQHGHRRSQLGRLQLQPAPKNHGLTVTDVVRMGSEHMYISSIQLYEKYKYVDIHVYVYNIYILHFSYPK